MGSRILFHIKFFFSLCLIATTMAVACPEPIPPGPQPPDPDTRSEKQIAFEGYDVIGLYLDCTGIILYNQDQYQFSRNDIRKQFRLQSDNQRRYFNIRFISEIPSEVGDSEFCSITYRLEPGEETDIIIKLCMVKKENGLRWLWNDSQAFGVIIFE